MKTLHLKLYFIMDNIDSSENIEIKKEDKSIE